MLAEGRNLDVVASARLIWYPHALPLHYERLDLAFAMAAAIDKLTQDKHPHPGLYDLLLGTLKLMEAGEQGMLLELWFKIRLLEILGYQPGLDGCTICGRHDQTTSYLFSPERGGIVCLPDAPSGARPISHSGIKLWRLLCDYSYVTISQISDGYTLATTTLSICDEFYEHHLGRAFRTHRSPETIHETDI
jgi:DNA repair protein RecO (recombination protein O)